MRVAKDNVDVKMQIPGAVIRQRTDFGDASGYGKISGEYFTLGRGRGHHPTLPGAGRKPASVPIGASCCAASSRRRMPRQARDGQRQRPVHWPPGHNVKVDADAEIVMFSPQHEHSLVIDHMIEKTRG